jgi:hypothetical protein
MRTYSRGDDRMNSNLEQRYSEYLREINSLKLGGTSVIEFEEGIGVMLTEKASYVSFFTKDFNVGCNGLCLRQNCIFHDEPITFKFINAKDCVNFIFLNMYNRRNQITLFVNPKNCDS